MVANNVINLPQVYFSASLRITNTVATGKGKPWTIICEQVLSSIGGGYDDSTGIFTAPVSGLFLLTGNTQLNVKPGIGGFNCWLYIQTSSTICYGYQMPTKRSCAGFFGGTFFPDFGSQSLYAQGILPMSAGDTARLIVQSFGGLANIDAVIGSDPGYTTTQFSGKLIGTI